jgi:hypothetical protein
MARIGSTGGAKLDTQGRYPFAGFTAKYWICQFPSLNW